jgi:hypothetical protein
MNYKNNSKKFISKLERQNKFSKNLNKKFKKIKYKFKIKIKKNYNFRFPVRKYYKSYLIKLKQYNFIGAKRLLKIDYLIIFYIII